MRQPSIVLLSGIPISGYGPTPTCRPARCVPSMMSNGKPGLGS